MIGIEQSIHQTNGKREISNNFKKYMSFHAVKLNLVRLQYVRDGGTIFTDRLPPDDGTLIPNILQPYQVKFNGMEGHVLFKIV